MLFRTLIFFAFNKEKNEDYFLRNIPFYSSESMEMDVGGRREIWVESRHVGRPSQNIMVGKEGNGSLMKQGNFC